MGKTRTKEKPNWLDPNTTAENEKLPGYLKWAWSSRGMSLALNVIVLGQITYYCMDMLGMSATLAGMLLLASKLFDVPMGIIGMLRFVFVKEVVTESENAAEGDRLTFIREPGNPYDENAIRIQNQDGVKLGYVPKKDNIVFARLMDAGKLLFGKVSAKKYAGIWLKIDIQVYLHE